MSKDKIHAYGVTPPLAPDERPGATGGARAKNRQNRTEELVDAALRLFLERGLEAVTVLDIANEAGLAKGSFYRYFDSKTTLIETMIEPVSVSAAEVLEACNEELAEAKSTSELMTAYQRMALQLSALFLRHRYVIHFYLQESRNVAAPEREPLRALQRSIDEYALELTRSARTHGLLRPTNPKVSAFAVIGAVEKLLLHTLSDESIDEPTAVASSLIDLVLHGIATDPDS
jgi:AcrR family transcriptional regulator